MLCRRVKNRCKCPREEQFNEAKITRGDECLSREIELHPPVIHVIRTFALPHTYGGRWRIRERRNYFCVPSAGTVWSDEALFNLNALNLNLSP